MSDILSSTELLALIALFDGKSREQWVGITLTANDRLQLARCADHIAAWHAEVSMYNEARAQGSNHEHAVDLAAKTKKAVRRVMGYHIP